MAISFGSVGDIIAVCLLAKDVVEAFDDSRGSAVEYRDIVRELGSLERCLLQVDLLCRSQGQNDEILSICDVARATVQDCRAALQELSTRVKKYDRYMVGSNRPIPDALMKIRFHISEKEWIEKSRAKISSHRENLSMLLATANLKLQDINGNKMDGMKIAARSSHRDMAELLGNINQQLGNNTSELSDQKTAISKIAESICWIRQMCAYTKTALGTLMSLSFQMHNGVMALQTRLPSSLERTLVDDPFILEDALGRKAPVHLQFIDSWDSLHAVLKIRFRSLQGADKVARKEYVLQDCRTGRDITPSRPWAGTFLPGQRVNMSMVFKHVEQQSQSSTTDDFSSTCPGCKACNPHPTGVDVEW
ncbi:hypothetical protein MMYC01_206239 [Madurella mycetomatis]|uniref:Ubiquitin-like domain-containing protein n=1 Tax=Madurella mycetomatis TaxID=100816 RepID=A0A175W3L5_9PEZI|nr:hypothetical protein MMYC01_206239 [Madurella mycetomatis]